MTAGCCLCPRRCGARRGAGFYGRCAVPERVMVCRAAPHFGEEPCISGTRGSGAVFFAGCNLHCVFCQNHEISRGPAGRELSREALREVFLRLRDRGVHNLNLVTGSHYSRQIAEALSGLDLGIPVIWNSSGYETPAQLRALEGLVQVYLPDFKYMDRLLARRYSGAPDYPEVAAAALREMYRQTGPCVLDSDGMLCRGVMVRHLILPGAAENTLRVIEAVQDLLPAWRIRFSLMSQYTPMPHLSAKAFPELARRITPEEYRRCMEALDASYLLYGYTQEPDSAGPEQIPAFDLSGVKTQ